MPISYFAIVGAKYLLCLFAAISSLIIFILIGQILPIFGLIGWTEIPIMYIFKLIIFAICTTSFIIFISLRWSISYMNITAACIYFISLASIKFIVPEINLTPELVNAICFILLPAFSVILFLLTVQVVKKKSF